MQRGGTRGAMPLGSFVGSLLLAALGAATCAAGGETAPSPAPFGVVSGSRLRAMFYDGGGGALLFRGWFDSELGVQCALMRTRNGQMRCLPTPLTVFWDSTCTMPLWWRTSCPVTPPAYVTAMVAGPAGAVHPIGDPYSGAVHEDSGGVCSDRIDGTRGPFYGTGAEIPSERFVAATVRVVPIEEGKLSVRTSQNDDGSSRVVVIARALRKREFDSSPPPPVVYVGSGRLRVPSYVDAHGQVLEVVSLDPFFDAQADAPCRPERFADGLRCVPRTVTPLSTEGPYLDADCTALLSETGPSPLTPASALGTFATAWDCSGFTAYVLGDVVTPAVVYFKKGPTCDARTPGVGSAYRSTAPTGDSQWAPVTERTE